MDVPSCTVVTANFYLDDATRTLTRCFENMKKLLDMPCHLVIYSDSNLMGRIIEYRTRLGLSHLTKGIEMRFDEYPTYSFKDKVIENRQKYWPTRDSRSGWQSHLINCGKIKLLQRTMEENPFGTKKFAWFDSNLGEDGKKIAKNGLKSEDFLQLLRSCESDPDNAIRIQIINCTDKKFIKKENWREFYTCYRWIMAGAAYVCGKDTQDILEDQFSVFLEHTESGFGHADELLWLGLLDKYYDRIKKGYGDYGDIVKNFIHPVSNHHYVYYFILKKYLTFGYHREAYDCAQELLRTYPSATDTNPELHFEILFSLYLATFYHKRDEAETLVEGILNLVKENSELGKAYEKNKTHYDKQFAFAIRHPLI